MLRKLVGLVIAAVVPFLMVSALLTPQPLTATYFPNAAEALDKLTPPFVDPLAIPNNGRVAGGQRSVSFAAVCEAAYIQRIPLFAQGYYRTPDIHFDRATGRGRPFHYFAFGAAVSEVERHRDVTSCGRAEIRA